MESSHPKLRAVWITVDASADKTFLSNCKECRSGKRYLTWSNAASHLIIRHFKRARDQQRPQIVKEPSRSVLKEEWMREVREILPTGSPESALVSEE